MEILEENPRIDASTTQQFRHYRSVNPGNKRGWEMEEYRDSVNRSAQIHIGVLKGFVTQLANDLLEERIKVVHHKSGDNEGKI